MRGFRNFLMRGDVIVVAVGLVIALAFSMLITAFTTNIINPIVARFQGKNAQGLGVQLGQAGNPKTFVDFGAFNLPPKLGHIGAQLLAREHPRRKVTKAALGAAEWDRNVDACSHSGLSLRDKFHYREQGLNTEAT